MPKLNIVIPTYNESENIKNLLESITGIMEKNKIDYKIIIVDDNSPDGTWQIVEEIMKNNKNIHLIKRAGKLGLGSAYIEGFKYAFGLNPDYIMSMDADFSHDPKYIPDFIEKIKYADIVVGSRYAKGGGVSWKLHRRIMSKGANLMARILLRLKVSDVTGAFRLYKTNMLKSIDLDSIKSDGFSFLEEILFLCKKNKAKMTETPIFFNDRREGKSKLSKKEMVKFFFTIIRLMAS